MSAIKEPGPCPFCAWDHPADPPHAKGCIIGPHVEFARAEGVAAERARVVAWLRAADSETLVWFAAQRIEQGWHDKEGER